MVATALADSRPTRQAAGQAPPESPETTVQASTRPWLGRLHDRFEDWLAGYPDTRPVRVVHRAPMLLWRLGLGRFEGDVVLTTTGRTSGLPRRVVIGPHRHDGHRYLWNPYGKRAQWYRNLVADPIVTVQDAHGAWTARAVHPTDHDEAVALYEGIGRVIGRRFHLYLADLGVTDSAEGFARDIERVHVVRLDRVNRQGPPPLVPDLRWVWPLAGLMWLMGLAASRRSRAATAGALGLGAATAALRGRDLVERVVDLAIRRPTGRIGRSLYKDATAMHGKGWALCHQKLALTRRDRLLDVGCGGGTFLGQALETVETAAGLDHSADMVELTRQHNAQAVADGRLEVRLGDAAALPWPDASFDAVSNLAALMLVDDPAAVLRESARVLRPGGRFVVVTMARPDRDDLGARLMRWVLPGAKLYADEELAQLLADAGFSEVQAGSADGDLQFGYGVRTG